MRLRGESARSDLITAVEKSHSATSSPLPAQGKKKTLPKGKRRLEAAVRPGPGRESPLRSGRPATGAKLEGEEGHSECDAVSRSHSVCSTGAVTMLTIGRPDAVISRLAFSLRLAFTWL
jgi:hypothetical protein